MKEPKQQTQQVDVNPFFFDFNLPQTPIAEDDRDDIEVINLDDSRRDILSTTWHQN